MVDQNNNILIAVVDDDTATCHSLQRLLRTHGYHALTYESAGEFMASGRVSEFDCLILDVRMPGLTGLELQECLLNVEVLTPIIYITGYINDTVRAGKKKPGTLAILEKPFAEADLIAHVQAAIQIFK